MHAMKDTFDENQKKTNKRPKSSTRFPKQMPSYIVAFAVHETYDDIATAQQMICNKRSLQSSAGSVSPALSSKTITIDQNSTQKLVDAVYSEHKDETKIIIDEDTNDKNDDDVQNELPEIKDYLIVDNEEENDINNKDSIVNLVESNNKIDMVKPVHKTDSNKSENEDEFEAIKKPKTCVSKLSKRKRQNQYRIRNVDFKYKKSLKRAEKVCKRSAKIKETFYSNSVSKVVSRASLLKSVPAKVNIIDTTDSILMSDDENNNNGSLQSSPSTTKKSFISYSSQDTLRQQGSTSSSRNEGMGSINTVNSVIKLPSENKLPYKTEVINVSVAVASYPTKSKDLVIKTSRTEPYRSMYNEDLMSTETLVQATHLLTSESTSSDTSENIYSDGNNQNSDRTLKPIATSENTYVVGSSDDSSMRSEETLAPNSETFMFAESLRPNFPLFEKSDKEKLINRPGLLDTVINMGIFPEINASTSSAVNFTNKLNNVFVTGDTGKYLNPKFKGDQPLENVKETSKHVLKKSFDAEPELNAIKNLDLPNESAIKAIINDNDKVDNKYCSGEIGNYPSNMSELWDRLVMVVDTAVKRLENSLTEKIINEMRKTFTTFEQTNRVAKEEIHVIEVDKEKGDTVLNVEVSGKEENKTEMDEILQCDLVGNQVIDNIMMKLSVEGPKTTIPGTTSKSFIKIKRPKIFRDYFEVLKPPVVESAVVEGMKGDTVTVSTTTPSEIEEVQSFNRVKSFLSGPLTFVRENMLVITSVPAFFVVLLCFYGLIFLVMKPW
ncbi:uncharacterized protein LOC135084687 isoform X2 [Ostrinia nubilalis]|uniref:uncharacterized protein LOC135084687 isoform X2 n=1 Tax=Ostrinia nubilalis TaxID=29057 RepID=UPI0030824E3F